MRDHVLGFFLALLILAAIAGLFVLPAIIWLGLVIVALLIAIFVRLGSAQRTPRS